MKSAFLFLFSCVIATGFARPPVFLGYQDSLGQYSFGYSAPGSARSEVRTSNGATRGTYSYVDETGVIQTAHYVADGENGFRVTATNLPQAPLPVEDTPEVMAARVAHLQALEMATKKKEVETVQSYGENLESAAEKKIEGDASIDGKRERAEVKSAAKTVNKKELRELEKVEKDIGRKNDSDESLQAVAAKSGVDKEKENPRKDEESGGKATPKTTDDAANIAAILPSIFSRTQLPQTLGQNAVPVFRISHGNYEIEPSAIEKSSIAQDASVITPAGTTLKSGAAASATEGAAAAAATPKTKQRANEQSATVDTLPIAPLSIVPLSSIAHSSFVGYVSPASLHYVTYNVL